jgi:hypothetical protein
MAILQQSSSRMLHGGALVDTIFFARTLCNRRDRSPVVRATIRTTEEELGDLELFASASTSIHSLGRWLLATVNIVRVLMLCECIGWVATRMTVKFPNSKLEKEQQ